MTSPLPPLAQASSGALGAVVSNLLIFPLDTLVSRLQTSSSRSSRRSPSPSSGGKLLAAVQTIYQQGGWRAFYDGLLPDSLSTLISQFVYFFLYAALREGLMKRKLKAGAGVKVAAGGGGGKDGPSRPAPPLLGAVEELAIGCLAGVVAKGLVSPLSMIVVRMQTSKAKKEAVEGGKAGDEALVDEGGVEKPNRGRKEPDSDEESEDGDYQASPSALKIAREIYDEQGIGGFWSGFQSTIILTLNPAITYYTFAALQRALIPAKHREHPRPAQTFLCGAVASAFASFVVYPLILAKTRLQFRSPTGRRLYTSQLDVLRQALRKGGLAGLYQGLEAQLAKGFFSEGIKLLVKDRAELLIVLAHRLLVLRQARSANLHSS